MHFVKWRGTLSEVEGVYFVKWRGTLCEVEGVWIL